MPKCRIGFVEVVVIPRPGIRVVVLAEIGTVAIAVVVSRLSAHVELTVINAVFGMKRNDDIPFAVHEFAGVFISIGRPRAVADPFIKRSSIVVAFDCRVVDFHAIARSNTIDLICSVPTRLVLQIQAAISFHSICCGILRPTASTDEQTKRCSALGIDGCTRKIDGIVVDNPVTAGCIYEPAEFT